MFAPMRRQRVGLHLWDSNALPSPLVQLDSRNMVLLVGDASLTFLSSSPSSLPIIFIEGWSVSDGILGAEYRGGGDDL